MGLLYHVWFSTKRRKVAFDGELRTEMNRILVGIARDKGIRLVEIELVADHAHMLVEVDKRQNLSDVMKQLKDASARYLFLKYPELKIDMKSDSLWQKGFGQRWVPRDQIDVVRGYIRTQAKRPYRRAS
jgi:putative transposase